MLSGSGDLCTSTIRTSCLPSVSPAFQPGRGWGEGCAGDRGFCERLWVLIRRTIWSRSLLLTRYQGATTCWWSQNEILVSNAALLTAADFYKGCCKLGSVLIALASGKYWSNDLRQSNEINSGIMIWPGIILLFSFPSKLPKVKPLEMMTKISAEMISLLFNISIHYLHSKVLFYTI